jgi:lysophospholipase L1-like esterase
MPALLPSPPRVHPGHPAARPAPGWTFRIAALAVGLAVSVAAAELVLRLVASPAGLYVSPPDLRVEFLTSPEATPGIDGVSRYTVNSVGVRGREPGTAGPEYRVLAVGGSTAECQHLDDGETWPARLEAALGRTADGTPVWVGNAGKSGRYSRDHFALVKYLPPALPRIDAMVVLLGANDLLIAVRSGSTAAYGRPDRWQVQRTFDVVPRTGPWNDRWYEGTALHAAFQRIQAVAASRGEAAAGSLALPTQGDLRDFYRERRAERRQAIKVDQVPDLTAALDGYAASVEQLIDLARARSIRLVLLTQPTLLQAHLVPEEEALLWLGWKDRPGSFYTAGALGDAQRRYNERLLAVCAARGAECIDLDARIPRRAEFFYDDYHFNERGAGRVAEVIAEHLRARAPFTRPGA